MKREILENSKFRNSYNNFDARSDEAAEFLKANGLSLEYKEKFASVSVAQALVGFDTISAKVPLPEFAYIVEDATLEEELEKAEESQDKESYKISGRIREGKRGYTIELSSYALDFGEGYEFNQKRVKQMEQETSLEREELLKHLIEKTNRIYSSYGRAIIERKKQ